MQKDRRECRDIPMKPYSCHKALSTMGLFVVVNCSNFPDFANDNCHNQDNNYRYLPVNCIIIIWIQMFNNLNLATQNSCWQVRKAGRTCITESLPPDRLIGFSDLNEDSMFGEPNRHKSIPKLESRVHPQT